MDTVARKPLENYVSALSDEQLANRAERLRDRLCDRSADDRVRVEAFGANG